MTISSAALTRAWVGVLVYVVLLSVVGAFAIPAGQEVVIRWSWGDWIPVESASKPWGLILVPLVGAVVALVSIGRRRASTLEFVQPPFSWAELLAMFVIAAAHTTIVLVAI